MMCAYATWDSSDLFHGQTGHPGGITMEDRYPARDSADHASIGAGIQAHDGSEHWNVLSTWPAGSACPWGRSAASNRPA